MPVGLEGGRLAVIEIKFCLGRLDGYKMPSFQKRATSLNKVMYYSILFYRDTLESLKPDCTAMMAAPNASHVRGVIVTLKGNRDNGGVGAADRQYDFISRYFSPWNGIPEDPVTG